MGSALAGGGWPQLLPAPPSAFRFEVGGHGNAWQRFFAWQIPPANTQLLCLKGIFLYQYAPFVAMPGAPSSFLFLVVRPGAPSSVAPSISMVYIVSHTHAPSLLTTCGLP